ncbi:MAG TPA: ABC transporter permease [Planctomycetota bacterium]|nr:ABC transporter permease [Planctomycetota bacterium]
MKPAPGGRLFRGLTSSAAVAFAAVIALLLVVDLLYILAFLARSSAGEASGFWRELLGGGDWAAVLGGQTVRELLLSLGSATVTTLLALVLAVPAGYALSRHRIPGKVVVDTFVDAAIVLPPLIMGVSLLVLFSALRRTGEALGTPPDALTGEPGRPNFLVQWLYDFFVYQRPGIVLAQFLVGTALAIRAMRAAFDAADRRVEDVALTLGCSRFGAFWRAALPQTWSGVLAGGVMCWSYSVGLFAPVQIFAGAIEGRTRVLPTRTFLEITVGHLELALALTLIMAGIAMAVLICLKFALRRPAGTGGPVS